jgi:hypothetical protein
VSPTKSNKYALTQHIMFKRIGLSDCFVITFQL